MKRTTNPLQEPSLPEHADFIFTADWHIRDSAPICRTDDFYETQFKKVEFVVALAQRYECPILIAGDVFDKWNPSLALVGRLSVILQGAEVYAVYGNHDLPQHLLELKEKCGLYLLSLTGAVTILEDGHWGTTPSPIPNISPRIAALHEMTYVEFPYPGCTDTKASSLLRKHKKIDCLVTGDNHVPFVVHYEGRILVNPGSLLRIDADQQDYQPRVYAYNAEENDVTPIYFPFLDLTAVSRQHLLTKEERDNRIDAFIEHIQNEWEVGLSFEENLRIFVKRNHIKDAISNIIYKSLE